MLEFSQKEHFGQPFLCPLVLIPTAQHNTEPKPDAAHVFQ